MYCTLNYKLDLLTFLAINYMSILNMQIQWKLSGIVFKWNYGKVTIDVKIMWTLIRKISVHKIVTLNNSFRVPFSCNVLLIIYRHTCARYSVDVRKLSMALCPYIRQSLISYCMFKVQKYLLLRIKSLRGL